VDRDDDAQYLPDRDARAQPAHDGSSVLIRARLGRGVGLGEAIARISDGEDPIRLRRQLDPIGRAVVRGRRRIASALSRVFFSDGFS